MKVCSSCLTGLSGLNSCSKQQLKSSQRSPDSPFPKEDLGCCLKVSGDCPYFAQPWCLPANRPASGSVCTRSAAVSPEPFRLCSHHIHLSGIPGIQTCLVFPIHGSGVVYPHLAVQRSLSFILFPW